MNVEPIKFPRWVKPPTPCTRRTFSVVLPGTDNFGGVHGAVKIVQSFPNRPMVKLPRKGVPGYYLGWATPPDICAITGLYKCKNRHCELHYMDAPVQLEK